MTDKVTVLIPSPERKARFLRAVADRIAFETARKLLPERAQLGGSSVKPLPALSIPEPADVG
jgi:hypothetical protein